MWIASVFVFTCVNLNSLKCFSFFKIFGSLWHRPMYCGTVKDENHILGEKCGDPAPCLHSSLLYKILPRVYVFTCSNKQI